MTCPSSLWLSDFYIVLDKDILTLVALSFFLPIAQTPAFCEVVSIHAPELLIYVIPNYLREGLRMCPPLLEPCDRFLPRGMFSHAPQFGVCSRQLRL